MKHFRIRLKHCVAAATAVAAAMALSLGTLAADTYYLINGIGKGAPPTGGILNPPSPSIQRDELGAGHSAVHYGLDLVTEEMRTNGPAYYGVKNPREARAPGEPAPGVETVSTPRELAEKYNITIIDQPGYLTGPYAVQAVALIDAGLQKYSTEFVRTVVEKYAQQGIFFCVSLHYPKSADLFRGATEVDGRTVCINLTVPTQSNPGGVSQDTVSHEFGHAVYFYLEKCMGQDNLARQWQALNGPYTYGSRNANRAHAFVSDYGSKYYYEDPATIFEAMANATELSAEKLADQDYTPLRKKVEFLEQCVEKYIGTPGTLFRSVWDMMTEKTS